MGLAPVEGTPVNQPMQFFRRWNPTRVRPGDFLTLLAYGLLTAALSAAPAPEVCVVMGAAGDSEFAPGFKAAASLWEQTASRGGARSTVIGTAAEDSSTDRDRLQAWIKEREQEPATPAWIVYLGHGTFDGREARLNLRGPDVTANELASWLQPVRRQWIVVHGGSAGAPFISALSAPGRIIITATRSGHELNYARFGERFAKAVADASADIDQDGQTSVLEAFVTAAQQTQAFYQETGRLATEHALIDDNGDKQGTPAEWFRGTRLQRRPSGKAEADGLQASLLTLVPSTEERSLTPQQREERVRLEKQLEALRARKTELPEADYYRQLELIFRELGEIYRADS
jgi:hypothetical protein